MKILAIADYLPMFDRASGDLRFYTILKMLAVRHAVRFCCYDWHRQLNEIGENELARYQDQIEKLGVEVIRSGIPAALNQERFDVIWFEFYYAACANLAEVRFQQPGARVIIDTVDVHFHRLFAKARLSKMKKDLAQARTTKKAELRVYKAADFVIAITEQDRQILLQQDADIRVEVLPNIHKVPALMAAHQRVPNSLVFVGGFSHEPNVDAMLYFCQDVLPLLRIIVPHVRLRIVGNAPTDEVKSLASEDITVVGFVPETAPYLFSSDISIAPLRYGGGIKGKIGEALAHGLPVVTTPIGAEGFGFQVGKDVLVADTPQTFADAIVTLWRDRDLYENIRKNGWNFINDRYSVQAVDHLITPIFVRLSTCRAKRISPIKRIKMLAPHYLDKYVLWRLRA